MTGDPKGRSLAMRWVGGLVAAAALAGCDGGLGLGTQTASDDAEAQASAAPTAAPVSGDVEAPEAFQAAEPGLWGGRPSLGGIWVAHPDVTDPERVRIVNRDNGQTVIGALFRRERDLPGPALQVSSDAAEALGMLAGAPANLDVTALRRVEAQPAAEPEPAEAEPAEAAPEAAPAAGAPAEPVTTSPLDDAPTAALRFPYVQLGSYNVETFATDTAQGLAAEGLPARLVAVPGQEAWRLLLGPAATEAEQEQLLERAVAEGFADAYLVRS